MLYSFSLFSETLMLHPFVLDALWFVIFPFTLLLFCSLANRKMKISSQILQVVNTWFLLVTEEILKSPNALWFSPDAHFLLYASFNDSLVGELKYPWYGRIQERLRYPQIRMLRYPKVIQIYRCEVLFILLMLLWYLKKEILQLCYSIHNWYHKFLLTLSLKSTWIRTTFTIPLLGNIMSYALCC